MNRIIGSVDVKPIIGYIIYSSKIWRHISTLSKRKKEKESNSKGA